MKNLTTAVVGFFIYVYTYFMKNHSVLAHVGLLSVIFAVSHLIALKLSLYWMTSWFDIYMHTFGGFIGALLVIYVLQKMGISPQSLPRKIIMFMFVCISVLAVGAIWELWEIFVGFTDPFTDVSDTILDLIMDTIGAIIGFVYYDKKIRTKK